MKLLNVATVNVCLLVYGGCVCARTCVAMSRHCVSSYGTGMIVKGADILQDSFAKPDANGTQHLKISHMNPDYIFGGKHNDSFLDAELVRAAHAERELSFATCMRDRSPLLLSPLVVRKC